MWIWKTLIGLGATRLAWWLIAAVVTAALSSGIAIYKHIQLKAVAKSTVELRTNLNNTKATLKSTREALERERESNLRLSDIVKDRENRAAKWQRIASSRQSKLEELRKVPTIKKWLNQIYPVELE